LNSLCHSYGVPFTKVESAFIQNAMYYMLNMVVLTVYHEMVLPMYPEHTGI
jgi:hypothetical protein